MKINFELPDELYKKFNAALVLVEREENEVLVDLVKSYIETLFPQQNSIHSVVTPPVRREENKVENRLPLWAKRPGQLNHKILQTYFLCEENEIADKNRMREFFVLCNHGTEWQFDNNFASMCTNEGQSHGKVFECDGLFVSLAPEIKTLALKYRDNFIEHKPVLSAQATLTLNSPYSPDIQKQNFVRWFKKLTYKGKPYNPVTISGYSGRIENACQDEIFSNIYPKNLFLITDINEFLEVKIEIQSCEGYGAFDAKSHNGFTAALNKYEEFLRNFSAHSYEDNISRPNVYERHNWSMDEDMFCCRKYLEYYVIHQSTVDISEFVRILNNAMPQISPNSLKMKVQNIKQLCIENNILDSLKVKPLSRYSTQNADAFVSVKNKLGL